MEPHILPLQTTARPSSSIHRVELSALHSRLAPKRSAIIMLLPKSARSIYHGRVSPGWNRAGHGSECPARTSNSLSTFPRTLIWFSQGRAGRESSLLARQVQQVTGKAPAAREPAIYHKRIKRFTGGGCGPAMTQSSPRGGNCGPVEE